MVPGSCKFIEQLEFDFSRPGACHQEGARPGAEGWGIDLNANFSRIAAAPPRAVVFPRTDEDVSQALRRASEQGLQVSVRGTGHSLTAGNLAPDGMLLVSSRQNRILLREDGLAEVEAGATWAEVQTALTQAGLAFAVLPNYLRISVGGTLSVGGYGARSVRFGAQVDHVAELDLVTGDGERRRIGPQHELFGFALAGLGQVGYLARAVLRTVPRRAQLWATRRQFSALEELVGWLTGPREQPVALASFTPAGAPLVCTELWEEPRSRDPVDPEGESQVESWLAQHAQRYPVWADYLVDSAGLQALVPLLEPLRSQLAGLYLLVSRSDRPSAPLAPTARPGVHYGVGLYFMTELERRAAVEDQLAEVLARVVELGGRPYLYGCNRLTPELTALIYGPALDELERLRSRYDPQGLFARLL